MAHVGTAAAAARQWPDDRSSNLLEVDRLQLAIDGVPLLSDVSFSCAPGEVVGLVGESGSGKTLTGLSVMGLLPRGAELGGHITFDGTDLVSASAKELRRLRGTRLSMIFQEPRASLHPARPVGKQIVDVVRAHEPDVPAAAARERGVELLAQVGLPSPRRTLNAYTHELSGGMCQRVMIAMALVCRPALLIADEPTTALDVTIQAQIIALLRRLADERGLSVVLISHNLGVVSDLCSRVVTMYCGQVVNDDRTVELLRRPRHPYPSALLRASDVDLDRARDWAGIAGTPANPARPPHGCRFHPRCPFRTDACEAAVPPLEPTASGGMTRCVRHAELDLVGVAA
ncbi:ABC transporter ATP-binding protein [Pseudonocardia kunmingensis]|uniref:Oligopeptide/dipeptide ABC transporter ATP-binding protein n=1 Tax=Pseudonocardia kunmingensis TaxID=630975 RepID=A0A543CXD8_9PSEU|nr:ABC transporter ATP-binding protein [Pseudonocardia kunmingensis]TQM01760.1 oligopeptide/dipeptide ABC transporter ATP-binding protein [Pseudonocardia kunmingensis]